MGKIYYFSYSRQEKDEFCQRARYLSSDWGGTGLTPAQAGWELVYGNIIHNHLNHLATDGQCNPISVRNNVLEEAKKLFDVPTAQAWAVLGEGHIRGFLKAVWPRWLAEYDILEAEKLRSWEIAPERIFRYRQDLLLKNRFNGSIRYVDYKTTSSDSPAWIASWAKSPQLHSSMHAHNQMSKEKVDDTIVQGLYKGYKDKKTGHPSSIFSYGWVNREYAMTPQYSYTYMRSKGWEKFCTFDEFDDLSEWVANMPFEILTDQFPQTGPIFPREDIAVKYFRQQLIRENEIANALHELEIADNVERVTEILDTHFKQNFSKCQPSFGFSCEFLPLCWQSWVEADPLGSALFKRREQQFEDGTINE